VSQVMGLVGSKNAKMTASEKTGHCFEHITTR